MLEWLLYGTGKLPTTTLELEHTMTTSTTPQSDIDAVFDLAASSTPPQDTDTPAATATPENATQSDDDASSADKGGALYPKVLKTLTVSEAGDGNPDGTLTVAEFAGYLTVENIKGGKGVEGIVQPANIYTAVKAARHPLPVVLVFADDADQNDLKNAKVYLPLTEALAAYESRPTRGEGGNAAASKKDQDSLLSDAAKRAITLASIQKRLDRAEDQKAKATNLLEKSYKWLAQYYKATDADLSEVTDPDTNETRPETVEEASKRLITAAIAERAAKIEEEEALKAEAEKSDIPDNK